MKFFRKLLSSITSQADRDDNGAVQLRSGDLIAEASGGANLVDGVPTYEHAEQNKDDLEAMLRCCDAELETMAKTGFVAAPYYFERAAILFRKSKRYKEEVEICSRYLAAVNKHYKDPSNQELCDVRKGPRFQAIKSRLAKARALRDNPKK